MYFCAIAAIRCCLVHTLVRDGIFPACFPAAVLCSGTLSAFLLIGSSRKEFPYFRRYYQGAKTSPVPLACFACCSLGDTSCSIGLRWSVPRYQHRPGTLFYRFRPNPVTFRRRHGDLPCSRVIHTSICPALRSRSGHTNLGLPRFLARTYFGLFDVAPRITTRKAPTMIKVSGLNDTSRSAGFRSIRFVPPSLSDYPAQRDSLPAVCQTLPGGSVYPPDNFNSFPYLHRFHISRSSRRSAFANLSRRDVSLVAGSTRKDDPAQRD